MSAPLIVLMKHADVLNFGFFPDTLDKFFSADFLSLISDKEKIDFQVYMGSMLKGGLVSAMESKDFSLINTCVVDAKVRVLTWGFQHVGWITRTNDTFEWTAGHSMETTAAAVIAAKVAASAPPVRQTKLRKLGSIIAKRSLGVKKSIVESRAAKFASAGVTKAVEIVSQVKDFSELVEFGTAAGNGVMQIRSGDYSGAGSSLLTAVGVLRRSIAPRPNLIRALNIRPEN
jgi:hypothetical protein